MHYIKKLHFFLLLTICSALYAQTNFNTLGETSIAVNHSVSKKYSTNFAVRSRYHLYRDNQLEYKQQQFDIFHFSTLKLNFGHDLSIGIYYRNRNLLETGSNETRIIQQFNYKKQKLGVRYGHRFRSEQRFLSKKTIFRQRYRFAVDFPLQGEKLDIGEAYFVGSLEGLLSLSEVAAPEIDSRTAAQIGWQLSELLKLQTGLEYRLEALNLEAENNLYVLTSAVLKI